MAGFSTHDGIAGEPRRQRSDRRAVPDDFARVAPTMSARALFRHYRTSPAVIRRWKAQTGIATAKVGPPTPEMRPIPDDFATRAPTTTTRALARHYQTGFRVVVRWAKEAGVQPMRGTRHDARPVPEDFEERAATMCTAQLVAHYDCASDAIQRWSRLTGVVPPKGGRWACRPGAPEATRTVRPAAYRSPKVHSFDTLRRDTTFEGSAADHLRKWAPVYRCTERGGVPEMARPDDKRLTHWRYGNAVLTTLEMIERARAKGFEPEAWRALAA